VTPVSRFDPGQVLHRATIELSDFAWSALTKEAERQEVPLEDLLAHAALYYLADLDSGRVAARVFKPEQADRSQRRFDPDGSA
jgi:hypothetical protein